MTQTLELQNKAIKLIPALETKAFDLAESGDDYPRVKFVASATTIDLYGDQFTVDCLQQMAEQFKGKTSFIDHKMDLEHTFGKIEDCQVEARTLVEPLSGIEAPHHVLTMVIKVAKSSPEAMHVYNLIQDGINVGASVTIYILESQPIDGGVNQISKVYGLETSACGIPANQNAWVEQLELAIKSIQSKGQEASPVSKTAKVNEGQKMTTTKRAAKKKFSFSKKNIFDDVLASNASSTVMDLCQVLCQGIASALDGGDDPAGAIKEMLSDFSDSVMSQVQPAIDAMTAEPAEEEAAEGTGDDNPDTESSSADDAEAEKAYKKVKHFLFGSKAKKDAEDWLTPNGDGTPDATAPSDGDFAQTIHDLSVGSGAMCMNDAPVDAPNGDVEMGDLEGYSIGKLGISKGTVLDFKRANQKLVKLVGEKELTIKKWEAIGPMALAKIDELLKQPITQ